MEKLVNIIGAGLSGCEAAYQLSKRNIKVKLYEKKTIERNPVQKLDYFAELVCSNTLRSTDLKNAVGTLKEEMRMFDSLIIKAAEHAQIPAGGSLAVDRDVFSKYITDAMHNDPNIEVIEKEFEKINDNEINLIASGPLTSEKLQEEIANLIGQDYFYFFDAVAPIITKDSINMDIAFRKNRYEKGETQDYINCPMNREQYEIFYNELVNAQLAPVHLESEKNLKYFEGCMPVEVMAKRGFDTLTYGPLKPAGLRNLDGTNNFAVVQLRQDNAADDLYNFVGFQTNLTWPEQKRVFRLIPGLENANFVRYGVMHQNNFINSPTVLNEFNQLKSNNNIFFAGQITGVEGYVESTSSGIIAAINIARMINEEELRKFPKDTVMGGLQNYIISTDSKNFQPMKANWSIVENLEIKSKIKKEEKKELYSNRAINSMKEFIKTL
ncbi:methylenetetrahydrofolate--tRNA-(uracil(54)-C(5))-methyltransferase (FADH(2)-oxidizing) TrmFO [Spiroplasma sp. BIUS-1]|uniref:methylenetetrahydrofolate--tRNA-(uracil(54)- C(5))-methyltransferase (FADH(2)-oxidizing) TrmFO n=1 Tax=Spiroplasma sp. BIUS-1 TaxID=216964 RepID=UPI001397678E|nr:methylenetetrahydrofolate--tRNA-(uracil(54)-C(5))-methyltransferase (FADH(2)-oxidizing) TrmFO [Spiroplasma sp. BIUS-1]QHX36522.1 tRNA (uracil-5-)-methyltransferase Gid [Spiroplasma sp. BIUS-1]